MAVVNRLWVLVVFLLVALVGAVGCYDGYKCNSNADCFAGQVCRSGSCLASAQESGGSDGPAHADTDEIENSTDTTEESPRGSTDVEFGDDGAIGDRKDGAGAPCSADGVVDGIYEDFEALVERVEPGETVLLCGGTTRIDETVELDTGDVVIRVVENETHFLDAGDYEAESVRTGAALEISADGVELDAGPGRFVVKNSPARGIVVGSKTVSLKGVTSRNNRSAGFHVEGGAEFVTLEYCSAHGNSGPVTGPDETKAGGAVGFAVAARADENREQWPKQVTCSKCLAHHNRDDGFDLSRSSSVVIEKSISYANGDASREGDRSGGFAGVGFLASRSSGFYSGVAGPPNWQTFRGVLAWGNNSAGVLVGPGEGHIVERLTAWNNGRNDETHPDDLSFVDTEGATLQPAIWDSTVTSLDEDASFQKNEVEVESAGGLGFNHQVDARHNPVDPSSFAKSLGDWIEPTLRQDEAVDGSYLE